MEVLNAALHSYPFQLMFLSYAHRYCYFGGFAISAPAALIKLRDAALSTFRLGSAELELLAQLNVWTRCCEYSVAEAVSSSGCLLWRSVLRCL